MENQLQQINTHQKSIVLSDREVEIAVEIYQVNQLTAFPLSASQIEDWSKSLAELYPTLDLKIINEIIRDMKLDRIEWNPKQGIQNITRAIKQKGINDFYTQTEIDKINAEYNI